MHTCIQSTRIFFALLTAFWIFKFTKRRPPGPHISSKKFRQLLMPITNFSHGRFRMREIESSLISKLPEFNLCAHYDLWIVQPNNKIEQIIFWFYSCQVLNCFCFKEESNIILCSHAESVFQIGHATCIDSSINSCVMMRRLEAAGWWWGGWRRHARQRRWRRWEG